MTQLVFFLEEPSAKEMLMGLLPRVFPDTVTYRYVVFEGKQDLEKRLSGKLRAWQHPDSSFVVLRDKDSANCVQVKEKLVDMCRSAGKPNTLVRIACHELESWFLGDLAAVEKGLNLSGLAKRQQQRKFRAPDELGNPKQELKMLTNNAYQQIAGSRAISHYLSLEGNQSKSFNVFLSGINYLLKDSIA
ncbi:MAG: DUF4276 family protein [Methylococcaceae bacterium]|nr:DUF4276 family protein [Methylococcaceae bacterium]